MLLCARQVLCVLVDKGTKETAEVNIDTSRLYEVWYKRNAKQPGTWCLGPTDKETRDSCRVQEVPEHSITRANLNKNTLVHKNEA